ncbi:MFS transporter [Paraglaciecola sp. L1A13]|uniref:MFS transporter n=1 Tax=Paraglaciecola sp. L1A13 TaxID=2686359 RepID=UPI00131AAFFB|nr:MFS transporter [Paraglaciecola sp. L1A13]
MQSSKSSSTSAFVRLVVISTMTKLADILISAKTTLPWIMTSIGAPSWMISLLVPIRESGSLIPQWPLKQRIQEFIKRQRVWRVGVFIQALAIMGMIPAVAWFEPFYAGLSVLILLTMLSLGRALCSLTMKDMEGVLIAKGRRGKLVGIASGISGLLSLLSAGALILGKDQFDQVWLLFIIGIASLLFIATLPVSLALDAQVQPEHNKQKHSFIETLKGDRALAHLIISRCLLLHSALVAPFFVSITSSQDDTFQLPYFIAASSMAAFLSSYLWGTWSDKSAVLTIRIASMICVVASGGFYLCIDIASLWLNVGLFFLLSVGYAGVRTARKTYLLDIASGDTRTQYVATANTVVGYVLLAFGGIYAVLYPIINEQIIALMSVFLFLGLIQSYWLKKEK